MAVVAIMVIALSARLGLVVATWDPLVLAPDPADYHRYAVSIVSGHGYPDSKVPAGGPTALRPPVYPYLLAGVYAVEGRHPNGARLLQALLGTVTVALIGLIAFQLWGRRVALPAMTLAAVFPPLIVMGNSLLAETVFLPLELGAVAAVLVHRSSSHRLRWAVAAGVLAGLSALTRANGVLFVLPLAIGVWDARPRLARTSLAPPAALILAMAVTIAPWSVRNALVMDRFVAISTQAGPGAFGTYTDMARNATDYPAAWHLPFPDPRWRKLWRERIGEAEFEQKLESEILDYVGDHPFYPLKVAYWNTARFLQLAQPSYTRLNYEDMNVHRGFADVAVYALYAVLALAFIGAFTAAARRAPLFLWLVPVLLFLSTVFIAGFTRYRFPMDPFLIILAALALVSGWDLLRRRWVGPDGLAAQA